MDALSTLLSWQFVLFCLSIYAVTFVFRTIIEYIIKVVAKTSSLWNDMVLPILPVIIGCTMGISFTTFPYPDGITNKDFRLLFGLVAGLLSTLLYRMVKALIFKKIQEAFPQALDDKKDNQ